MITAEATPPENGFSKDRLIYKLVSDDYIESAGTYAVNRFYFTAAMPAGITLQFRVNGQTQSFTVSNMAAPNGTTLPSGNGNLAFVQSLVPYFEANAFLSKYFTYSVPNDPDLPALLFTAKEKGKAFEMVEVTLSFGKIQVLTPASDYKLRANHCIFLELYLEQANGTDFSKMYEVYLPTTESGRAEIDLARVLNAHLQQLIEKPNWTAPDPVIGRGGSRRYRIAVAEAYGNPLQLKTATTLADKRVFWGGSGYNMPGEMSYLTYGNAKMKALQNTPTIRWVMLDEPSFLTFYNPLPYMNVLLKASIKWHDNTTTTPTLLTMPFLQIGEKVVLVAGHNQLNLPSWNTSKRVVEYTLWLQVGSTEISNRYRYAIDDNLRDRRKYFPYLNSLGGWEVLLAKGIEERSTEFEIQTATKQLAYPNQNGDAELFQYYATYAQVFACNTGHTSREEQKRFRDFALSPYKYRFFNGQVVPVILTDDKFREGTDDDNRHFISFNYRYGFNSNALLQTI